MIADIVDGSPEIRHLQTNDQVRITEQSAARLVERVTRWEPPAHDRRLQRLRQFDEQFHSLRCAYGGAA